MVSHFVRPLRASKRFLGSFWSFVVYNNVQKLIFRPFRRLIWWYLQVPYSVRVPHDRWPCGCYGCCCCCCTFDIHILHTTFSSQCICGICAFFRFYRFALCRVVFFFGRKLMKYNIFDTTGVGVVLKMSEQTLQSKRFENKERKKAQQITWKTKNALACIENDDFFLDFLNEKSD